jgi:hypothetical protein
MTAFSAFLDNAKLTGLELRTAVRGLYSYYSKGEADHDAWLSLLHLHCTTNGRSSDRLAHLLRMMRPARSPAPASGTLGTFSVAEIKNVAAVLARDGYHVFERRLSAEACDELECFAATTPAVVEGRGRSPAERVLFDAAAPISKTYRIPMEDIVSNAAMQQLMADPVFLAVAEQYLSAHPILCGTDMWWSPQFGDTPGADAAQQFHFDYDGAPVWLKFFVYLTDVTPQNGPHVFVRGSHRANHPAADAMLKRGYVRISDQDIVEAFGTENIIEICGSRGTVLVADTRGFHKGKLPLAGHRLIAQLFYCCPQFNLHGPRQPLPDTIHPSLADAIKATPRVFERFPVSR